MWERKHLVFPAIVFELLSRLQTESEAGLTARCSVEQIDEAVKSACMVAKQIAVWIRDLASEVAGHWPFVPVLAGLWGTPAAERDAAREQIFDLCWNLRFARTTAPGTDDPALAGAPSAAPQALPAQMPEPADSVFDDTAPAAAPSAAPPAPPAAVNAEPEPFEDSQMMQEPADA